jgi:hypothetical protein
MKLENIVVLKPTNIYKYFATTGNILKIENKLEKIRHNRERVSKRIKYLTTI